MRIINPSERIRASVSKRDLSPRSLFRSVWGRFYAGLTLLFIVLVVGSLGYLILDLPLGDAIYQTVITVTTVGYEEVGPENVVDTTPYKVFTVLLILSGTGTVLYTLSVLIELILSGQLNDQLGRRRMQSAIDRLSGHIVLCGFGQLGRTIFTELKEKAPKSLEVVVIDQHEYYNYPKYHEYDIDFWVTGEATDDNSLLRAGVDRASTLILALKSDIDNLYVVLTARTMNPDIYIVSNAHGVSIIEKLKQAGANRVVVSYEVSASKMSEMALSSFESEA
ncbi:MAG: NAD-binding protein [Acidimicrobiaceae bacterium]|nr:NAD-binding protein [Acidimicrobiaceae bacterium]